MEVWMVRAGKWAENEALALEKGLAVIGWSDMPDLGGVRSQQEMLELCRKVYPDAGEGWLRNAAGQLFSFAHRLSPGDLVALPRKSNSTVALGVATGPYQYRKDLGDVCHVRSVDWKRPSIPRMDIKQDLLYSLGSIMTVCRIRRNNAIQRFERLLQGLKDVDLTAGLSKEEASEEEGGDRDFEVLARDQILTVIGRSFKGHDFAALVEAILQADGYVTHLSPPGADGGVDILAGRGPLGFESPKLCVQVKSSDSRTEVDVLRALQGTMQNFKAEQGLLVSWGGFKPSVVKEAQQSFFSVRLWTAQNVLEALVRIYDRLPKEWQSQVPLKRIWTLVLADEE